MIENIPLKTRKTILFSSVFVIAVVIIFLKFSFFSNPIEVKNDAAEGGFKKFGEEMGAIIYQSKEQFSEIKNKVGELVNGTTDVGEVATSTSIDVASTSTDFSEVDIEKLKQELAAKLKEKVATTTATTTE